MEEEEEERAGELRATGAAKSSSSSSAAVQTALVLFAAASCPLRAAAATLLRTRPWILGASFNLHGELAQGEGTVSARGVEKKGAGGGRNLKRFNL